jgi:hypothetical protein
MIVTTLSTKLLEDYGRSTVATWADFTQRSIVVVVSPEEVTDFEVALGDRYRVLPFSESNLRSMMAIRVREAELNYRRGDFRWQAGRFSWKVFAMQEVFATFPDEPSITWLDADSILKPGFDEWLEQVFSPTHAVSFLGRTHKSIHAETGLINFIGLKGRELCERIINIYRSLELFEFNEWHDGYVFTSVLLYNKHCFDISKHYGVRSSNPLYEIDRGKHLLHLKGMRKNSNFKLFDDFRILLGR